MKAAWPFAVVGCCLMLSASASAVAICAESIDWVLATSDRVVIGKVIDVKIVPEKGKANWETLTIAVSSTLKGESADRVKVVIPLFKGDLGKLWKDEAIPLAFFIKKNDGKVEALPSQRYPWRARLKYGDPSVLVLGKSKHEWPSEMKQIITRDLDVLHEPNRIVGYLSKAISVLQKDPPQKSFLLNAAVGEVVDGNPRIVADLLDVPIDQSLQAFGREWCKSGSGSERQNGAMILARFKNDKNIEVLKSLLADPSTSEWSGVGKFGQYRKTVYFVRRTAYAALRQLGEQVERPMLQIMREGADDPERAEPGPEDLFWGTRQSDGDGKEPEN